MDIRRKMDRGRAHCIGVHRGGGRLKSWYRGGTARRDCWNRTRCDYRRFAWCFGGQQGRDGKGPSPSLPKVAARCSSRAARTSATSAFVAPSPRSALTASRTIETAVSAWRSSKPVSRRCFAGGAGRRGWPAYLGDMSLEVLVRWYPPVPGAGAVAPVRTGGASRLFRFDEASLPARYRRRAQSRYRRDRGRFPIVRVRAGLTRPLRRGLGGRLPGRVHRPAYRGDCGGRTGNRFRLRARPGVP